MWRPSAGRSQPRGQTAGGAGGCVVYAEGWARGALNFTRLKAEPEAQPQIIKESRTCTFCAAGRARARAARLRAQRTTAEWQRAVGQRRVTRCDPTAHRARPPRTTYFKAVRHGQPQAKLSIWALAVGVGVARLRGGWRAALSTVVRCCAATETRCVECTENLCISTFGF